MGIKNQPWGGKGKNKSEKGGVSRLSLVEGQEKNKIKKGGLAADAFSEGDES